MPGLQDRNLDIISMDSGDGSIETPLSHNLKPVVCRLELMTNGEIVKEVLDICSRSGISESKMEELSFTINGLRGNRPQLQMFVVNLTLAAQGLKAIPTKIVRRKR